MRKGFNEVFVHFFAAVFFVVAALAYFSPVLQGKVIYQSDIALYTGMAKEQNDFRRLHKAEPYWTNSAFGGMPTYQLGAHYPHNYVKKLDGLIRFLPRPADYLFVYLLGFYILLSCLKVDYRLAIIGALAFGFSTYMIIILGVGHNAKAHALGYLPMLLGGIVLVFRKKYLWGFVLTAVAMALEIGANHYQMTYYFMLLVLVLGIVYLMEAIKRKRLKHYFTSVGILIVAVAIGIATNATGLMATKEYADWSTRGKSALTIDPIGNPKENVSGLSKEYITQYSYGITESLNLFVPRLFGGSNSEDLGEDSRTYEYVIGKEVPRSTALRYFGELPLYWGKQPGTAGPAYIGAVIFFLFFLGLFMVKGSIKWWLALGALFSLILSWGKNFGLLTNFMIDYFPLYDKFRAVSSIQVILELCAPALAMLAVYELFRKRIAQKAKQQKILYVLLGTLGLGVVLFLFKGSFDFYAPSDDALKMTGLEGLPEVLRQDRKDVYSNDLIRSLVFVLLAAASLWLFVKGKIKKTILALCMGLLIVVDLVGIDQRYVNKEDFVAKRIMSQPFQETQIDRDIAKDGTIFRVFDPSEGINGSRTSYFHQSIGGYHAAKPAGMQDLFEYQIYKGNTEILNMLNVRYVVQQNAEGGRYAALNTNANGNAWFIESLQQVTTADGEISALDSLNTKKNAVVNTSEFTGINRFDFQVDSLASISLVDYQPNQLRYESTNPNAGIAVFSEMHYPHGWNAYVDGKKTNHFKVNYVLRALRVPEGKHTIEFKFEPEVIKKGSTISLAGSIALGLIVLASLGLKFWQGRNKNEGS